MSGEGRRCRRCGDEEFRIDGYCTIYCKDVHAVERDRDEARARLGEVLDALDEFAEFPSEAAREAADAVLNLDTCIPLHEAVNNMHDALRKRRRERDEALAEVARLTKERNSARSLLGCIVHEQRDLVLACESEWHGLMEEAMREANGDER